MGKFIALKMESLKNQFEALKCEVEKLEKTKKKPNFGLKKLKGVLKGQGNFSEEELFH